MILSLSAFSRWPRWLKGSLFSVAWVAIWGLGHLGEASAHASVWYPPAAMTFAALVIVGYRIVPYLFIASMGGTLWSVWIYDLHDPMLKLFAFGLANAVAHIGSYGAGAAALRAIASRKRHSLPEIVIGFLVIATLASATATLAVISSLVAFGLLDLSGVTKTALAFWIGDFVAVVVLAPLFAGAFLKLAAKPGFWIEPLEHVRLDRLTRSFVLKLAVTCLVVAMAMLTAARLPSIESAFLVFFMLIPQMWLTYSESPLRTALSLSAISFLIIVLLAVLDLSQFVYVYQFAIAIVATSAYFGIALPLLVTDNQQLRQRLMIDPLTGAASRHFFLQQVQIELSRTDQKRVSSLAVVDLDFFKQINDKHGHQVGDKALVALAETLRTCSRGGDIVARFGGDEFVMLLPDTDLDTAGRIIARTLQVIRSMGKIDDLQLTASIGLTETRPGDSFESCFQRADAALYQAKDAGRNQFCVSQS